MNREPRRVSQPRIWQPGSNCSTRRNLPRPQGNLFRRYRPTLNMPRRTTSWGLLRLQWRDLDVVIGSFREALRIKPRYAPAQLCLANAFTQLARANQRYVDEAILAYRRAVSLVPRQRLSWYSACKKGSKGMSRPTFASTKPRR